MCTGPAVSTPVYENRSLALAAICVAWSPVACAAATTDAAPAPSRDNSITVQSDGVGRYCILAIGNKLGQVIMWRLDLPSEYGTRPQGAGTASRPAAAGAPPSSPAAASMLQWMGALRVHRGGAHVLRLVWNVAPEGSGGNATGRNATTTSVDAAVASSGGVGGTVAEGGGGAAGFRSGRGSEGCQWRVPQPHSTGLRDNLLLLTGRLP